MSQNIYFLDATLRWSVVTKCENLNGIEIEIKWYPNSEILQKELPGTKTFQVILDTIPNVLVDRLKDKGHNETTIQFILDQRNIFLEAVSKGPIDCIVDTSINDPQTIAKKIIDCLNFQDYF